MEERLKIVETSNPVFIMVREIKPYTLDKDEGAIRFGNMMSSIELEPRLARLPVTMQFKSLEFPNDISSLPRQLIR